MSPSTGIGHWTERVSAGQAVQLCLSVSLQGAARGSQVRARSFFGAGRAGCPPKTLFGCVPTPGARATEAEQIATVFATEFANQTPWGWSGKETDDFSVLRPDALANPSPRPTWPKSSRHQSEIARLAGVDRQLVRHWAMRAGINVTRRARRDSARPGGARLESVVRLVRPSSPDRMSTKECGASLVLPEYLARWSARNLD